MDTADVLREKAAQIEKLWSDIGKIIDIGTWAENAYLEEDVRELKKAIERGDF